MMATDGTTHMSEYGSEFENGLHEPLPVSEKVNGPSNGSLSIEELSANLDDAVKLSGSTTVDLALPPESHSNTKPKVRDSKSFDHLDSLIILLKAQYVIFKHVQATGVKESSNYKNLKPQKGIAKAKNVKPLSPGQAALTELSKSKDGKEVSKSSVASNGGTASESLHGKTTALKTRSKSFNEKQAADNPKVQNNHNNTPKVKVIYLYELLRMCSFTLNWIISSFCGHNSSKISCSSMKMQHLP